MQPREITLKDGRTLVIREPEKSDAKAMLQYLAQIATETEFLLINEDWLRQQTVRSERAAIAHMNRTPRCRMILGLIDGEIVSTANAECEIKLRIRHNAGLAIAVRKAFWNIGVATAMLTELMDYLRGVGDVVNIQLAAYADNTRAIALYKKLGFTECGRRKNYFFTESGFHDELLLERTL